MGCKQVTSDLCAGCFEGEPCESNKIRNRCENLFVPHDEQSAWHMLCKLLVGGA